MDSTCNVPGGVSARQTVKICPHCLYKCLRRCDTSRYIIEASEGSVSTLQCTDDQCAVDQSLLGQHTALACPIIEQCDQ